MGERGRRLRATVAIVFGSFVILTWLPRAWAGRWIADDFCFAVSSVRDGFWRSQQLVYLNASGRFSVALFYGVVTRFGRWAAPYIAVALMIAWLLAAWRAARHALPGVTPYEQIAAGVAFVAAIVAAAPDSYQPLIWTGGLATYGIPVVCATIIGAMSFRATESSVNLAGVVLLAFFSAGYSEVAAAAQVIFALAAAACFPRVRRVMLSAALASAAALAIVAMAPGNFKRRTLFQPLPALDAATLAVLHTPRTLATIVMQGYVPFIVLFVLLLLLPRAQSSRVRALVMTAGACAVVAVTLCGALYGTGRLPWGRVQFIPVAYTALALVFVALAVRVEKRSLATALTVAMIVLTGIEIAASGGSRVHAIREAQQFARAADDVDAMARRFKGRSVAVRAPREFELLEFLDRDPKNWTNRCMAEYYGLTSLSRR